MPPALTPVGTILLDPVYPTANEAARQQLRCTVVRYENVKASPGRPTTNS